MIDFLTLDDITKIRIENHKTFFTCLDIHVMPLCDILKYQNTPYKYYSEYDIPDGVQQYALDHGRKEYHNVGCFESYANLDDLQKILEEIPYLLLDEADEESDGW